MSSRTSRWAMVGIAAVALLLVGAFALVYLNRGGEVVEIQTLRRLRGAAALGRAIMHQRFSKQVEIHKIEAFR